MSKIIGSIQEYKRELTNKTFTGLTNSQNGKPLIVCLHGYLDNAASFVPLIPLLNDYHLIALDLAGHGKAFRRNLYNLTDYVYDLLEFSESLSQPFYLIGHSLGGIVGSIFAACYPEHLKKFISIEAMGPLIEAENTSVEQLRQSFASRLRQQKSVVTQPASLEQAIQSRLHISDMQAEHARLILQRNIEDTHKGLNWRTDRALRTKSALRFTQAQAMDVLRNISVPMSVFLGTNGFSKVKRNFERRREYLSNLESEEVFDGGHHVHMEQAQRLAQSIKKLFV